jgi:hypothetical protein
MERLKTHVDGVTRDMTPEEEAWFRNLQASMPNAPLPAPQPSAKDILDLLVKGGVLTEEQVATLLPK